MFKNMALFWKLGKEALRGKKEINAAYKDNGWKSRKFFIAVINIGLSVLAVGMSYIPAAQAAWIIFGISSLYFVANVVSKMTPSTADDEFLAALRANIERLGIKPEEIPVAPANPEEPKPADPVVDGPK